MKEETKKNWEFVGWCFVGFIGMIVLIAFWGYELGHGRWECIEYEETDNCLRLERATINEGLKFYENGIETDKFNMLFLLFDQTSKCALCRTNSHPGY